MEEEKTAYEIFSRMYPHESYKTDPKKFCEWIRNDRKIDLTDEEIKKLIDD